MSARTKKQQEEDMLFAGKVSIELMEKKVHPLFYDLAIRKNTFMGMSERHVRKLADILMALKPATYIRYMYEDMINGKIDDKSAYRFKLVNDVWEQESAFWKQKKISYDRNSARKPQPA